jgi:hypothetical protein
MFSFFFSTSSSCRPVDCYTHEPLVFTPGFVNATIYGDQVETGWNFGPYFLHSANFWLPGAHPCVPLSIIHAFINACMH